MKFIQYASLILIVFFCSFIARYNPQILYTDGAIQVTILKLIILSFYQPFSFKSNKNFLNYNFTKTTYYIKTRCLYKIIGIN